MAHFYSSIYNRYSARRLGAVLYSRRNGLGSCCKSIEELSALSNCAVSTVRKGLEELAEAGYITVKRRYCHSKTLGRVVYDRSTYHCNLDFTKGYTQLPRDIFAHKDVSHATFIVLMYLHQQVGNTTRAFPSLRKISKGLGMGLSTVCRAVQAVKDMSCWLVRHCVKRNNAYACNSYHIVKTLREKAVEGAVMVAKAIKARVVADAGIGHLKGLPSCSKYTRTRTQNQPTRVLPKSANYVNT